MFKKYEPLIKSIASKLIKYVSGSGLEQSDLEQEGMLGLSNAIDNFSNSKEASFYTYAKSCIEKKMLSQVVSTKRFKRKILNDAIPFDANDQYGTAINLDFFLRDESNNPEKILINEEKANELLNSALDVLTDFETQVLELKVNGFEYREIAEILEKEPKAIDNAIQRIRKKLKDNIKRDS
jgi:RNA polymerase sporulation-specific sigma factor